MATLSGGDLTKLRTGHQAARLYLSVFKPATLLTALINEPAATPGMRQIDYDGGTGSGFSLIEGGQVVIFNGRKVGIKSITGNQSAGTITLLENSEKWVNNGAIEVQHDYPLLPRLGSFDAETGTFYKDIGTGASGVTYAAAGDPNSEPPPVCVVGVQAFVGWYRGSVVNWSIDLTDSYPVADGATITGYSISISPSGAGLTSTFSTTFGTGVLSAGSAGQWIVRFGVTDSNGKTQYTYRKVITTEPYQDFTVGDLSGSWDAGGWAYGVTVSGAATLSDFPDEALAVLWHENTIDGAADYVNIWAGGSAYRGRDILCAGYIQNDQSSDDYETGAGTVSFRVETPESLLATRTDFGSLELQAVASPSQWYEYASWLTVGRAILHHLKWHSTACEVLDLRNFLENDYGMRFATFTEASLLQRDNNLAFNNGINAKLCCDHLGRLHLARDSQLLGNSERAALDTVFELTAQDVSGQFSTTREPVRRVVQTVANGFSFDGTTSTPLLSIAPGNVPENSGTARVNRPGQVLDSQDELNERTGRFHNVANATLTGENVSFRSNYLGAFDIIPSLGMYEWGLTDNTLKRQLALNGQRLIARSVQVSLEYRDSIFTGNIRVTVTFEWEVEGESGQTDTYPGFPECPPGAGTSQNIEEDPTPGDELVDAGAFPPVVLMAFSSANYRLLDGSNDWAELAADTVHYGTIDKFWVVKANSYDPANLITWISGAGFIKELTGNAAPTVTDRTPSAAPPDTWSDTPDPAVATCSYIQIESDWYTQDEFYTLAEFQNGSSLYRGWVGKRTAGSSYTWLPLYDTGGSLPTQSRPIFMAVTCQHILVTCWQDLATDKLKLLVFTKSPFAFSEEVDLGDCTLTQLDDRELLAFPAASPDYSDDSPDATAPWYVAGRMDDPAAAFGDIAHIIQFDGVDWTEVELLDNAGAAEAWGSDYCGALVVGPNDPAGREYWAVRLQP
jgi:hypothetical protein